jgi:acetylornithine deacetylase/succinyl-diaminopimelate desuccinylase-like protein
VNDADAHDWVARELLALVEIDSPSGKEHEVVEHLADRCRAWDLPVSRLPVDGAADDLVVGGTLEPALVLTAHVDTVVPTWSWTAGVADGLVRGLGATDCKGSVVAFLLGWLLARDDGVDLGALPVAIGLCTDEELLGRGSIEMADRLRPRWVIAGEPSRLEVGIAEAGFVDAICDVHGRAAHGSFPERGTNAIEQAARLVLAVHDRPFATVEHPLLGRNVPGALWIEGGGELHVVPDEARVRIEIRVVPGGPSAAEIEAELRELAAAHGADVRLVEDSVEPFELDRASPVRRALQDAVAHVRGSAAPEIGVPAWTDAHNFVDRADADALVWGPGDFGLAHDPDEAVPIDDVVMAARVVHRMLSAAEGWIG